MLAPLAVLTFTLGCTGPDSALSTRLRSYVDEAAAAGFSGVVRVGRAGEPIFEAAVGNRDDQGAPVLPATVFDIGSITKQFTAAAVLRLEELGRLKTTDTIGQHLPSVPANRAGITLHQLLTHTSGLPANVAGDYEPVDRATFLQRALSAPLGSPPGTQYDYSNTGYSVLAAIIEIVTGGTYEAFLQDQFFRPLGMTRTGYLRIDAKAADIAVGFRGTRRFGRPTEQAWAPDGPYWGLRGNGGILSTAQDMWRWDQALRRGRALTTASQLRAYTRHVEEGPGSGSFYGYGWALFPTPRGTTLVAHNGGNGAFYADLLRYQDEGVTIIVLSNRASPLARTMARNLSRMVFDPAFVPRIEADEPARDATLAADDPRAAVVRDLLAALDDGRPAALQHLVESRFDPKFAKAVPMERHVEVLGRIAGDVRGRRLARTVTSGSDLGLVLEGGDAPLTLRVVLEGPEHRIAGMGLDD